MHLQNHYEAAAADQIYSYFCLNLAQTFATFKDQLEVQAVTDAGYFCHISFRIAVSVELLVVPPNIMEFAISITP